ncbi:MAG: signal peptidase I [Oscillibacter sp.]|uniref:signal peptidase I n=1 Tax=Oscillibacter sp. TaxID=1945593 RepID=UPI00289D829F|nr:signal peptidase I [Oscillibacter sp.]MEA4994329.1 signal peptidase I [Oscillibacter sp.]
MWKTERYEWYAGSLLVCAVALMVLSGRLPLSVSWALWGALAAVLWRFAPRIRVPGSRSVRAGALAYAFLGAGAYLAALYLIGVFMGALAASPYDRSPKGLLVNLLRVLLPLSVRELVRAYCFGAVWRACKYRKAALAGITLLLFLADLRYARLLSLSGAQDAVSYITQSVAPALAQGIFLSVLVFYGGAGAGIVYAAIPVVFEWGFPFLPSLPWLAQGAVGMSVPLLLALMTTDRFRAQKRGDLTRREGGALGFFATLAVSVVFAWFVVGVFPIYPSVVLTGSMEPLIYPGDAVLIRKLSSEQEIYRLTEGEIINFKRGSITITHRIVSVIKDEAGNLSFQTKGDNNDSPDVQPVGPNDINGTVRRVVPKVGLPVLLMKSGQAVPEGVTDHE